MSSSIDGDKDAMSSPTQHQHGNIEAQQFLQARQVSETQSASEGQEIIAETAAAEAAEPDIEICSICTEEMPKQYCDLSPCNHKFCRDCLLPWIDFRCHDTWLDWNYNVFSLLDKINCPLCRSHIAFVVHKRNDKRTQFHVTDMEQHFFAWRASDATTRESFADDVYVDITDDENPSFSSDTYGLRGVSSHDELVDLIAELELRDPVSVAHAYDPTNTRPLASIPAELTDADRRFIEDEILGNAVAYEINALGPNLTRGSFERMISRAADMTENVVEGSAEYVYIQRIGQLIVAERTEAFRTRALAEN